MKLQIYVYETDIDGNATGKLIKTSIERNPEKRGQHSWVCCCDKFGNEIFGYCELCGKKRK